MGGALSILLPMWRFFFFLELSLTRSCQYLLYNHLVIQGELIHALFKGSFHAATFESFHISNVGLTFFGEETLFFGPQVFSMEGQGFHGTFSK